ncbi:MAG: alpha/beta hydrolase [Candidatus Bathyarchaeia archaeon]|jgi:pimeloyl-ACP methyl ester carboxylesterase
MPYINVDSTRLYYEVTGKGHPILWLPPLLRDHVFMRSFTQPLAERYTAITMDLLGHGLSEKPVNAELYSYENLTSHCYRLIQHLKIDKHDIIGISWSGRIAIMYTLLHQHKVRALVLVGSSGPKHHVTRPPENPELSDAERFVVETIWQTPYDVLEDLKNIQVPTLILVGDKDPRLEAAHLMHANISKSTLTVIEGRGHEVESKLCVEQILNWLKDLP